MRVKKQVHWIIQGCVGRFVACSRLIRYGKPVGIYGISREVQLRLTVFAVRSDVKTRWLLKHGYFTRNWNQVSLINDEKESNMYVHGVANCPQHRDDSCGVALMKFRFLLRQRNACYALVVKRSSCPVTLIPSTNRLRKRPFKWNNRLETQRLDSRWRKPFNNFERS